MSFGQSLKELLFHELKIKRILTVDEVIQIATENGYKASNAERRLRRESACDPLPLVKLDRLGKPVTGSKRIYFYSWKGAQTSWNKKKYLESKKMLLKSV